jgi:adenosylmethionine-8-amino-7-oxononanoate aminotransferase
VFDAHCSTDPAEQFFHSTSYTANPIAGAAANANLAIGREEPVLERVACLGERQEERLAALALHPAVRNVRRCATIAALELGSAEGSYLSALGPQLLVRFRDANLLLRPLGNTVYVMPPYCIDESDLDAIYAAISDAADWVAGLG